MARKIYEHSKVKNLRDAFTNLFNDLKSAGLTQVHPMGGGSLPTVVAGAGKFVFDSSPVCNPLNETQKWRILVELSGASDSKGLIKIAIATPQQISDGGEVSKFPGPASDTTGTRVIGQLGNAWSPSGGGRVGDSFLSRNISNIVYDEGTLMSSILVVTNRGVFYQIWEEGAETPTFSTFCVQVPVNKDTGSPLLTDKSPIFCFYITEDMQPMRFTVSEEDIGRPSKAVAADKNTPWNNSIINSQEQVSIARGNKYLVTLPNRLNTSRFAYSEELDMFAYVSADVVGEGSEIAVTLYGEDTPRIYRALQATGANNTMVRLMALVENGGVPTA